MLLLIIHFDDINEAVDSDDGGDYSIDDNGKDGGGGGGKDDIVAPVVDPVVEPARSPTPPAVVCLRFVKLLFFTHFQPFLSIYILLFLNIWLLMIN